MKHLPFRVTSNPPIFHGLTKSLVAGIQNVAVYVDNILLTGQNNKEHLTTLNQVLELKEAGLRMKHNKCTFMKLEGLDASGLYPLLHKVLAVQKAPAPTNVTEVCA